MNTESTSLRIQAENIFLDYPLLHMGNKSLRSQLVRIGTGGLIDLSGKIQVVQALRNINFVAHQGDRIGLLGHNGSGKSTLLKVLAGIYAPNQGSVTVNGQVSCLLATGMGMNPDATGYENITLCGMHFGYNKKDIAGIIKDIEDFTELGNFLNLPTRTYSAGMGLRLSFAVATALNPDILLIDEIIGAGDRTFYEKAQARMMRLLEKSQVLVLASHDTDIMKRFCNKGMLLSHGEVVAFGPIDDVIENYFASIAPAVGVVTEGHL